MRRGKVKKTQQNSGNPIVVARLVPPLLEWFARTARDLPWRRTLDPYAIWVSEIMLQQTQVKTVIPYFERWQRELPDVQALAQASSEKIHKLWEGLGYYTRVRNMQEAAREIVAQHGGAFPRDFTAVLALRGIGRYTAGAICSLAFNQPTAILDGNVIRVLARVFAIAENTREKETNNRLWQLAAELVAEAARHPFTAPPPLVLAGACSALNQSLMELGATVCTPRAPRCEACPVQVLCEARRRDAVERFPNVGERATTTARRFVACVVERQGRVLLRQRPAGVVNAHLWEFPNVEVPIKARPAAVLNAIVAELGCAVDAVESLSTVRHSITRYRIALEVFRVSLDGKVPRTGCGQWKSWREVERLPLTSAHRRVAENWLQK